MKLYYCDNCDRLIKVNEQTKDMFVDEFETAYCTDCRESFCNETDELDVVEAVNADDSQFTTPAKKRPKSGFWRAYRRPKVQSTRRSTRRSRFGAVSTKRRSY